MCLGQSACAIGKYGHRMVGVLVARPAVADRDIKKSPTAAGSR